MPLPANSRLGHYEIKSVLGSGGMGEVYRARDTRLNRDVAIKVLHEGAAASADQRSRFEREARALAALNHPNIVVVYDFEVESGQQCIVSELIDGEPLRSLLAGKPVGARKILDIAAQVADGLAAAHAVGIIHRDLKPENILLTREGRVKILDFGLARHSPAGDTAPAASDLEPTSAPGAAKHLTQEGAVMGTASYMSPEQALGKPVDFRTDQFSFGLVLYELATGKRAFARDSTVETMAAIVREDPPPIEEKLPAPLKWIIDRCLAKEREQRYESTRDLFRELRDLRDHLSDSYSSTGLAPVASPPAKRHWGWPAALLACTILSASLAYVLKPAGQSFQSLKFSRFANDSDGAVWSPDGKAVAYEGKVNGIKQVFLRYLGSPAPLQLTHGKLDTRPLGWSSDRNHLIVAEPHSISAGEMEEQVKLYSLPTIGGELEFIMDATCQACALSPDGKTLATISFPSKAASSPSGATFGFQVSDPLGSPLRDYRPAPFLSAKKELNSDPWTSFSPDGKNILLILPFGDKDLELWLLPYPMGSGQPRRISALDKRPFSYSVPSSTWMPDNRHFVVSLANRGSPIMHHLWMGDTDSNRLAPITNDTGSESGPAISPDGNSILFEQELARFDVVSVSVEDGSVSTLITTGHLEYDPAWSAGKPALAWVTDRNNSSEIWVRQPGLPDRPAVTAADLKSPEATFFLSAFLSPNGDRLVYALSDSAGSRLWLSSLSGGTPIPLTNADSVFQESGGSWSPDGSRFVYLGARVGQAWRLMMVKTSGNAAPTVLKDDVYGHLPNWSPTGDWILFGDAHGWNLISPDGKATKSLGRIPARALTFSKDGRLLYGIQTGETDANEESRAILIVLDLATFKQKIIKDLGKDLVPRAPCSPCIRLSLAPDGKSLVYSTLTTPTDLWMLQGYQQPGWLGRFSGILK